MSGRYSPYNLLAGLGVQLKRIKNRTYAQTRFTRYLESIERLPQDELHRLQAIEMSKLLLHAVKNVPYYKHLNGKLELSVDTVHDDIKQFPIVTKEILGSQKEQFCDSNIPVVKSMVSGGTTMTRVSVNTDKYSETHKCNEYFNRVAGIYPGMKRFLISRHELTYNEGGPKEKDIEYYINKLSRTYFVNPYDFNEKKLKKAYLMYIKAKPDILKGNTAMLVEFAQSIKKKEWKILPVPIVFSGQNNMLPEYKQTLTDVFGARVHNAYGATESGIVAAQCKAGENLHYVPVTHYLETINREKQEVYGETGQLVITSLTNYGMPVIRFQIGDYATLTDEKCSCGRTFPSIKSIDGRLYETINTPTGSVVSVYEIKAVMDKIKRIRDFQIVLTGHDSIVINIKSSSGKLTVEEEAFLKKELLGLFECDVKIDIEYVQEILKLPSGKILRIISLERYNSIKSGQ